MIQFLKRMLVGSTVMLCVGGAVAQMPHEVLLLVNKNSAPSLQVANEFISLRKIPDVNVVYLDIPEAAYTKSATITPAEFTKLIWEPANAVAQARGIDDQVLAWVYSVDFPIRVKTDTSDRKQMSVGGVTFLRNKLPDMQMVEDGKYLSKIYAGSNDRLKLNLPAISLDIRKVGLGPNGTVPAEVEYLKTGLKDQMPLPSMMLGYIGEKGNDVSTVVSMLQKGLASDYRGTRKNIYFVKSDDVRSTCREWQYPIAVDELKSMGYTATISTNFPNDVENVMGLLMGAHTVDPSAVKSFAPGAMAEHLTSWSAEFQKGQTKMTDWISAGASGSAGSVVEPTSNPNKFPGARFFIHYGSGCTMLESFYQSIACPLQNLLIGDPLARPFAALSQVKILGAEKIRKSFTYMAQVNSPVKDARFQVGYLLDGKMFQQVSGDANCYIDIEKIADGYHELRAVLKMMHRVNHYSFVEKTFTVDQMGRSISVAGVDKKDVFKHAVKVSIDGFELPQKVKLICSGGRVLDEQEYSEDMELMLNELIVGAGPNRARVVAIFTDGMEVSSVPFEFNVN